ncbi:GEVED domain-containing protein [Flavobacterium enshiense]|uniref:GEVED domain-containing protein n=1 Tax=Flavobacterium enshiense TaxID=1341165 RepID=UPI00345D5415
MKRIITLILLVFAGQLFAQSTCRQTFTATGNDDGPTVLTINAADINCHGANPVTNMKLINAAGSLTSGYCSSDGSSWFGFDLSVDGGAVVTGCAAAFNELSITGFNTLTITSHDDDEYADSVTITIDVEVAFTPTGPPSCVALSAPSNGQINVASGQISWPAASGGPSGYKLKVGTTPGGTNVLNMVDVGNVLTYDLGALTPGGTYYVTVVPFNANGDAVGCTESSFTTCLICYCEPLYETGKTDGDLISSIIIAGTTLSNDSGTDEVNPAYTFFSGAPNYTATLQAGSTYDIQVTVGSYGGQNVAAWIDYDDDGSFETTERVGYTTSSITGGGSATFQIVLACNPSLGTHRMRIRDVWNTPGANIDPCDEYGFGETEDYNITISAPAACPQPSMLAASSVTNATASLSWNAGCSETVWNLHLAPSGGGAPAGAPSNPGVTFPFNATGLTALSSYDFYVQADCAGNGTSAWTGPFTFTTAAIPPANDNCSNVVSLTPGSVFADNEVVANNVGATDSTPPAPGCASFNGGDVWFSIAVPNSGSITIETNNDSGSAITDTGLAVYEGSCAGLTLLDCDDDSSADGNFSLVSLTGRTPGEILYVNVWEFGGGAGGTFKISAYDASLSTGSFDLSSFKVYPNPVKDVLNISYSSTITSVEIFNMIGQKVNHKSLNVTQSQIDMSNLANGAYIVKINVDGLTKSIKVIKQ